MTSGGAVKYNGSIDCAQQVIKNEGFMSLMKGAVPTSSVVLLALVCSPASTSSLPLTSSSELLHKRADCPKISAVTQCNRNTHANFVQNVCFSFQNSINDSKCSHIRLIFGLTRTQNIYTTPSYTVYKLISNLLSTIETEDVMFTVHFSFTLYKNISSSHL